MVHEIVHDLIGWTFEKRKETAANSRRLREQGDLALLSDVFASGAQGLKYVLGLSVITTTIPALALSPLLAFPNRKLNWGGEYLRLTVR